MVLGGLRKQGGTGEGLDANTQDQRGFALKKRTFFVKLNVDDFADEMDALESTEERGLWLEGFRVGLRGHGPRDGWAKEKTSGHTFGAAVLAEANDFRAEKAAAGRSSAEARRAKTGSAQPTREKSSLEQNVEHPPNTSRTPSEHQSNTVRENVEQPSNQLEARSQKLEARNEERQPTSQKPTPKPPTRSTPATFSPTSEHSMIASTRGLDVERQAARFRETNREAMDTPQNWDRRFTQWLAGAKPEPPPLVPLVANAAQPAPAPRPPFRWAVERDIRDAKAELAQLDDRYKEARWEMGRGTPDSPRHRAKMEETKQQMAAAESRITELHSRLATAI